MGRHSAEDPSQIRYPWRTTTRTVFQLVIGLAAAMPLIVSSSGLPSTVAGVGMALAISATITRVMATPAVAIAIGRYAPWLAAEPRDNGRPSLPDQALALDFITYAGNPADAAAALERAKRREQMRWRGGGR